MGLENRYIIIGLLFSLSFFFAAMLVHFFHFQNIVSLFFVMMFGLLSQVFAILLHNNEKEILKNKNVLKFLNGVGISLLSSGLVVVYLDITKIFEVSGLIIIGIIMVGFSYCSDFKTQ